MPSPSISQRSWQTCFLLSAKPLSPGLCEFPAVWQMRCCFASWWCWMCLGACPALSNAGSCWIRSDWCKVGGREMAAVLQKHLGGEHLLGTSLVLLCCCSFTAVWCRGGLPAYSSGLELDDIEGLFQPKRFCDSVIACVFTLSLLLFKPPCLFRCRRSFEIYNKWKSYLWRTTSAKQGKTSEKESAK